MMFESSICGKKDFGRVVRVDDFQVGNFAKARRKEENSRLCCAALKRGTAVAQLQ